MSAQVLDANGWPIMPEARVYVPPREIKGLIAKTTAIRGVVSEVHEDRVELIEFGSFSSRTVRPGDVKVQRGDTNGSLEYKDILEAIRRRR
jgi:hypothetical protein